MVAFKQLDGNGRSMTIAYVAYWGLREPLGRSLVLPAVKALATQGLSIDLITFEKPAERSQRKAESAAVQALRADLSAEGIRWHPLRYHKRPNIPATLFDVLQGTLLALSLRRPDVIHGRTFIGGLIGALFAALRRVPFVYHNEGFWPDQQLEGGFWPRGGLVYRVTKAIETALYGRAQGLVLLSRRSRPIVEGLESVRRRRPPLAVVASCVDTERFRCAPPPDGRPEGVRLVYAGSLGGRYEIEPLGQMLVAMRAHAPGSTLTILSHSDHEVIRRGVEAADPKPGAWSVRFVPHEEVPSHLCGADAGLFFLRGGIGALSCSPTKVGEYWSCGLPVVMSTGIGDIDEIVRTRRVGVLVDDLSAEALNRAAAGLLELLQDPDLRARCRKAALEHYDLQRGVADQLSLYREILARSAPERA